jgi:hypothetical protein
MGKLTLNVHNLESLYPDGTKVFLRAFQTDRSPINRAKQLLINTSIICAVSDQPKNYLLQKWHEEKQNIDTNIAAFQTHKLCGSS